MDDLAWDFAFDLPNVYRSERPMKRLSALVSITILARCMFCTQLLTLAVLNMSSACTLILSLFWKRSCVRYKEKLKDALW